MEWQIVGDALGIDPERARRDQGHLRLAETASGAIVADQRFGTLVGQNLAGAVALAVLELGE